MQANKKRLAEDSTRVLRRLPDEKRKEMARIAREIEEEFGDRVKKPSPARVAMARLKVARLREGLSLAEVAQRMGMDRGNLSKLENHVENIEFSTLARLADALGYELVVDLKKRVS